MNFNIQPLNTQILESVKHKIDMKTKPQGSLGVLENIAAKISCIQNTLSPKLSKPVIGVFAGDHGIALEGASPFPQEVTFQMVMNFLAGGAAINVFAKQNNINIKVVDAGVNYDFKGIEGLIDNKIDFGTKSYINMAAMTPEQYNLAIEKGAEFTQKCFDEGTNIIGFGEMGIANTSSSALIMHHLTGIDIENCVGRGTGHNEEGLKHKLNLLTQASKNYDKENNPIDVLTQFGGFELVMICGAILKAADLKMTILIDGFNVSASCLAAISINKEVKDYCIFTHKSEEKGHKMMLEFLDVEGLLDFKMRLGEGTGAAVAYPTIQSAVNFLNEMASFGDANISENSSDLDDNISNIEAK